MGAYLWEGAQRRGAVAIEDDCKVSRLIERELGRLAAETRTHGPAFLGTDRRAGHLGDPLADCAEAQRVEVALSHRPRVVQENFEVAIPIPGSGRQPCRPFYERSESARRDRADHSRDARSETSLF